MKKPNHPKRIKMLLLLVLVAGSIINVQAQNGWEHMAWLDKPLFASGSCLIDSLIYVFGGCDADINPVNTVHVFNTANNEWNKKSDLPKKNCWTNVVLIRDTVYMAGGWYYQNGWKTYNLTYSYDPKQDHWEPQSNLPKISGGYGSCVWNDKFYLFGGLKDNMASDTTGQNDALVYDPATDIWDTLPHMRYARGNGPSVSVLKDKIYVIGGDKYIAKNVSSFIKNPERYDPVENNWHELAEMPVAVSWHSAVVFNDKIYIFGGDTLLNNDFPVNYIQEYDPLTDQWQLMKNMPFTLSNPVTHKVDSFLYFVGGCYNLFYLSNEVWQYNLNYLQEGCEGVEILEPQKNLSVGDTCILYADVLPNDYANKTIIWTSDNEKAATVSEEGKVSCVGEGTATISAKLKYGSCSSSYPLVITGIKEIKEGKLTIYPNPTNNFLNIETGISGIFNIKITAINGQLLYKKAFSGTKTQLNISHFQSGAYFITVRSKDHVKTTKIFKL